MKIAQLLHALATFPATKVALEELWEAHEAYDRMLSADGYAPIEAQWNSTLEIGGEEIDVLFSVTMNRPTPQQSEGKPSPIMEAINQLAEAGMIKVALRNGRAPE